MPVVARGALPSPRHKLAGATPHRIVAPAPPQFLRKPSQLSMWGNDVHGDCVTAEEAFAKACAPFELFMTDTTVIAWATSHGVLEGADLSQVLGLMQANGFPQRPYVYGDGAARAVDWTNAPLLQNAIWTGPVKIGIAADQVEDTYQAHPSSGWIATGYMQDSNEDHCVSLCGYGPVGWMSSQLGGSVPAGMDASLPIYALYTWATIGMIDVLSMVAITGEAWLRKPTTCVKILNGGVDDV